MSSTVKWNIRPEVLGDQLEKRIAQIPSALHAVAEHFSSILEGDMRKNAPWIDRSGEARRNLFAEATRDAKGSTITLYGTKDYFPYLELGTPPRDSGHPGMAPRPIIQPTMQKFQTEIVEDAGKAIVNALTGGRS